MYMENHDKEEILDAISLIAEQMQHLSDRVDGLSKEVRDLRQETRAEFASVRKEMSSEFASVKNQMVTKDYLDRKIFELRGDFGHRFRQSEVRFEALVEEGVARKMYPREVADRILALEPAPGVRR